jgi:spore coat protein U-like protein
MKKELNKTKSVFVKNSKMSLAKSTTALTCLVGSLIITSELAAATATGSLVVGTSVATVCTVSAASMDFAAYTGSLITQTSEVTANCTNGTPFTISFAAAADGITPNTYKLIRGTADGSQTADYIEVSFTKSVGNTMTAGTASITGSGTGSAAAAGTITGSIAASQTGRTAGSFAKTMTLNIVY